MHQITRRTRVRTPGPSNREKEWRPPDWLRPRSNNLTSSPVAGTAKRWPTSNATPTRKWRSNNSSFDVFDKLMVREERGGKLGRQLSLEAPQRPMLRRQTSDEIRPGPLKIAWTADQMEQPSVEVVAKKCGQPKPSSVKPPRSPYHSDESAAVLYSRQQLTERLRSSWKKSSGRHNLNIFLNQSVESETESVSEAVDSPARSPTSSDGESDVECAVQEPGPTPALKDRDKSVNSCASDRRAAFRMMGRQSKILDSPCSTPEPSKAGGQPAVRRMMSAPSRPLSKKLSKAATVESRVKSAPSKRKHKPPQPRRRAKGDSSDDEKSGTRRVKRGVEKGEIVTMVSLVSPAESEEEEIVAATPDLKPPPTPKPPPESPRPNPPPPMLTLRKPVKAVSFRPVVPPQPSSTQYQTSFPLKRTLVHQNTTGSVGSINSSGGRPQLVRQATVPSSPSPNISPSPTASVRPATAIRSPSTPKSAAQSCAAVPDSESSSLPGDHQGGGHYHNEPSSRHQVQASQAGRVQRKPIVAVHPASAVRRKVIQATHSVIKIEPEPIKEAELPPRSVFGREKSAEAEEMDPEQETVSTDKPAFKNSREKECWDLFKKMSDRGVSVSFETVLRGLLTPTEYRMRRSALMSVC